MLHLNIFLKWINTLSTRVNSMNLLLINWKVAGFVRKPATWLIYGKLDPDIIIDRVTWMYSYYCNVVCADKQQPILSLVAYAMYNNAGDAWSSWSMESSLKTGRPKSWWLSSHSTSHFIALIIAKKQRPFSI